MHNGNGTFWKRNGLSIVVLLFMLGTWLGQILTGHVVYNEELSDLGAPQLSLLEYLASGHFVSATFENWESEFLQMGMYVLLSVSLRQRARQSRAHWIPRKKRIALNTDRPLGPCELAESG